uniref:GPI-anchored protein n=1 Tax=Ananas comosus var. bracteatus TaxID=296719 RepID=A0A6V7QTX3_ANACO
MIHLSMKLKAMWGLLLMLCLLRVALCDDTSIENRCGNEITKLTNCLDFATGKTSEPQDRAAVRFPADACAPGDCKIANSSITECPKLLNISPSSPDYSIFTNTTQGASTTSGSTTTTTTTSSSPMSNGVLHRICVHATVSISLISSIFFSIF